MKSSLNKALMLALIVSIVGSPVVAGEFVEAAGEFSPVAGITYGGSIKNRFNNYMTARREAAAAKDHARAMAATTARILADNTAAIRKFSPVTHDLTVAQRIQRVRDFQPVSRWDATKAYASSARQSVSQSVAAYANRAAQYVGLQADERDVHALGKYIEQGQDTDMFGAADRIALVRQSQPVSRWEATKVYAASAASSVKNNMVAMAAFVKANPALALKKTVAAAGWAAAAGLAAYGIYTGVKAVYNWATAKPAIKPAAVSVVASKSTSGNVKTPVAVGSVVKQAPRNVVGSRKVTPALRKNVAGNARRPVANFKRK